MARVSYECLGLRTRVLSMCMVCVWLYVDVCINVAAVYVCTAVCGFVYHVGAV